MINVVVHRVMNRSDEVVARLVRAGFAQQSHVISTSSCRRTIFNDAIARLSVVCNVRAPYSGGSNFRRYGIRLAIH